MVGWCICRTRDAVPRVNLGLSPESNLFTADHDRILSRNSQQLYLKGALCA